MTPMPPCCAIAIASRDSVTVSIAALTSGTFSRMFRVSCVLTSTCVGSTVGVPRHEQDVVEGQRGGDRPGFDRRAASASFELSIHTLHADKADCSRPD